MRIFGRLFVLLFLIMGGTAYSDGAHEAPPMTIQTIPLKYISPSDVVEVIEPLVQPHGRITRNLARNELVVMTTEDTMKVIRNLVESLDKIPLNVTIQVEIIERGSFRQREASLSGQGAVVIANGKVKTQASIHPTLINRKEGRTDNTVQTLMVMSGRGASLNVGEEIPYADYVYRYGLHNGYIAAGVQWQQVGSSLYIEPTVVGDGPMINVRVTPEVRALVDGRLDSIRYSRAATEVMVKDGESVRIGGHGEQQDFYSKFLFGATGGESSRQLDIVLTPRIHSPQ